MKNRLVLLSALLCVVLLGVAVTVQSQSILTPAAPNVQRWQYVTARVATTSEDILHPEMVVSVLMDDIRLDVRTPLYQWLDGMGSQGWELILVVNGTFIFKRPKVP